ncbi:MAG: putative Ig domain-containing protein, partial [Verrucomicrobiales bacterium]|nr:putative Ig domain-containing protein [Verrucomicrobiales bacterium]
VTDDGSTPRSSEIAIPVTVAEVNLPPTIASTPPPAVEEGQTLAWTPEISDPDLPANTLSRTLVDGPEGMVWNPQTHAVTWTPGETGGGQTFPFTLRVTDNGTPSLSVERVFQITAREVNAAPTIVPISNQAIDEGSPLSIAPTATDSDLPAQTLRWSLGPGTPTGASIHAISGALTWSPTEDQGPGDHPFVLLVSDDGNPPRETTVAFRVTVREVNAVPLLDPIPSASVVEGRNLEFVLRGTDPLDVPPNALSFTAEGLPDGARLDAVSGHFSWTPTAAQVGEHTFRVVVRDDGNPPLSASQTVRIRAEPGTPPRFESVERLGGQVRFRWSTRPGARYRVQAANSLLPTDWEDVREFLATGESAEYSESFEDAPHRYFRIARDP